MIERLAVAAAAAGNARPADLLGRIREGGLRALEDAFESLGDAARREAMATAQQLEDGGFDALFFGERAYPQQLLDLRRPPPILFSKGDRSLLELPAVGMCGSRDASPAGLRAARLCGKAVAQQSLVVISGNARGVDTEAHSGALEAGGGTIFVLAEGALRFKPSARHSGMSGQGRTLVLSQFPPRATWNVGNAMTRNGLIAALGDALVVIEARAEGGTLNAGLQGLEIGRPVIALEFETGPTPPGNTALHARGAIPIRSPASLTQMLAHLRSSWQGRPQLSLPFVGG
jgi:DNA processing protein